MLVVDCAGSEALLLVRPDCRVRELLAVVHRAPRAASPARACDHERTRTHHRRLQVDKVELQSGDDGLALTASVDIAADTEIIKVRLFILLEL
jgi:hypothetical protein